MPDVALPKFRRPPVIETVLGVEFSPLPEWSVPHFGLFWDKLRAHYPKQEVHVPIASQVESFDAPLMAASNVQLQFASPSESRCWFLNEDGSELLQVQNDRIVLNWRKRGPEAAYPGYHEFLRPRFNEVWTAHAAFLAAEGISQPVALQCEVAYVSHIPHGEGWNGVEDWSNVFAAIRRPEGTELLKSPESAAFNASYRMPENSGRLRIDVRLAMRKPDGKQIIATNITARSRPEATTPESLIACFDKEHDWVVRGFADATTPQMHKLWERYQ